MQSAHEAVAAEVRAEMGRQRLTGRAIARRLGWSDFYISRRLRGEVPFNINELAALAAVLEVPVTAFIPDGLGVIKRKRSRPRAGLLVSDLGLAA